MARNSQYYNRIGVFDSGLGGLLLLRSLIRDLPAYDFVYLGDTKRVPYGARSKNTIYEYTRSAITFLYQKQCRLIIIACNTSSALALPQLQRDLPLIYPDCKVLGVLVPMAEVVHEKNIRHLGVLATSASVYAHAITHEIKKHSPHIRVTEQAAPLLVPIVEHNELQFADSVIAYYVKPLLQKHVDGIALGCTHYPLLKNRIRRIVGNNIIMVSQDEFVSKKLTIYLDRHQEIDQYLFRTAGRYFFVTDKTPTLEKRAKQWFGGHVNLQVVDI